MSPKIPKLCSAELLFPKPQIINLTSSPFVPSIRILSKTHLFFILLRSSGLPLWTLRLHLFQLYPKAILSLQDASSCSWWRHKLCCRWWSSSFFLCYFWILLTKECLTLHFCFFQALFSGFSSSFFFFIATSIDTIHHKQATISYRLSWHLSD